MADPNSCRTCRYRESGDDAYHCYMFKVQPEPLCMQHQDRKPKRVGTIAHVGGRTTLTAALAVVLAREAKDDAGVTPCPRCDGEGYRSATQICRTCDGAGVEGSPR